MDEKDAEAIEIPADDDIDERTPLPEPWSLRLVLQYIAWGGCITILSAILVLIILGIIHCAAYGCREPIRLPWVY